MAFIPGDLQVSEPQISNQMLPCILACSEDLDKRLNEALRKPHAEMVAFLSKQ